MQRGHCARACHLFHLEQAMGAAIVLVWLCALPRPWSIARPCWMSFRPGACGQRPQARAWVGVLLPLASARRQALPDSSRPCPWAPAASWPRSSPWQRRRPPHLCHAANWLFPKCAAQGGVSGHGFTRGKAQEFPQGQGIANCAGRCRAQSRCPETADHEHAERAARRDGPAARFFDGE